MSQSSLSFWHVVLTWSCVQCENIEYRHRAFSSLCVSAVVLTLGGNDIEDGVPDREPATVNEKRWKWETKQENDKHEEKTKARLNM